MIDARIQIRSALMEIKDVTVKMNFPKTISSVPLVTFFEITNANTMVRVRDQLSYQCDCWCNTFEDVIDLMQEVDSIMREIGFRRDYVSQDSDSVDASGYYRKTLRYSRYVDTRNNRLID